THLVISEGAEHTCRHETAHRIEDIAAKGILCPFTTAVLIDTKGEASRCSITQPTPTKPPHNSSTIKPRKGVLSSTITRYDNSTFNG
ncbi:hypothetical protein QZH63_08970, partial [Eikenella corrodens]|nr:hypothetical protein [Eikenella corrodens]